MIVEVPHFASLRDGERDVMVLRSDDGVTWYEHRALTTGGAVHSVLSDSFEGEGDYRYLHVLFFRLSSLDYFARLLPCSRFDGFGSYWFRVDI